MGGESVVLTSKVQVPPPASGVVPPVAEAKPSNSGPAQTLKLGESPRAVLSMPELPQALVPPVPGTVTIVPNPHYTAQLLQVSTSELADAVSAAKLPLDLMKTMGDMTRAAAESDKSSLLAKQVLADPRSQNALAQASALEHRLDNLVSDLPAAMKPEARTEEFATTAKMLRDYRNTTLQRLVQISDNAPTVESNILTEGVKAAGKLITLLDHATHRVQVAPSPAK